MKTKTKEKSLLKKKKDRAQKVFNEWVRLRDCLETTGAPFSGICFTCYRETENNGDAVAGHYLPDSKTGNSTSFDEVNVNYCCQKCNRYLHGNLGNYALHIIKKYGQKEMDRLQKLKFVSKKWTIEELDEIYLKYKIKIEALY